MNSAPGKVDAGVIFLLGWPPAGPPTRFMSSHLPTAAVIGAGCSGITALKGLVEQGIEATCFEASDRMGGNWVFANKNGVGVTATSTSTPRASGWSTRTSRCRSPIPDYPHHTRSRSIRRLRRSLRLPRPDPLRDRGRARRARRRRRLGARRSTTARRRALRRAASSPTATTGTRACPSPRSPARTRSTGAQMHSHDYMRPERLLRGKSVVVLGMGNSAMDIAVEASYVADEVYLAARRGAHIVPKYVFGKPIDQLAAGRSRASRSRSARSGLREMIAAHVGQPESYGLPKPDHALRRGAPDRLGPDPRPHRARGGQAEAEHRASSRATTSSSPTARASASTSSSTAPATRSRSRSSTRTSSPRPTTGSTAVPPGLPSRASRRLLRRAAPAARRDHADRRARRASGSPPTCGASTPCRPGREVLRATCRETRRDGAAATSPPSATRSRSTSTSTCSTSAASASAARSGPGPRGFALPVPPRARGGRAVAA